MDGKSVIRNTHQPLQDVLIEDDELARPELICVGKGSCSDKEDVLIALTATAVKRGVTAAAAVVTGEDCQALC